MPMNLPLARGGEAARWHPARGPRLAAAVCHLQGVFSLTLGGGEPELQGWLHHLQNLIHKLLLQRPTVHVMEEGPYKQLGPRTWDGGHVRREDKRCSWPGTGPRVLARPQTDTKDTFTLAQSGRGCWVFTSRRDR